MCYGQCPFASGANAIMETKMTQLLCAPYIIKMDMAMARQNLCVSACLLAILPRLLCLLRANEAVHLLFAVSSAHFQQVDAAVFEFSLGFYDLACHSLSHIATSI